MSKNGFNLIAPASINYTGTSATISENGSVSFSDITNLLLNGTFSSNYYNYAIVVSATASIKTGFAVRLASSSVVETGGDYASHRLLASASSLTATRFSPSGSWVSNDVDLGANASISFLYGPNLAQPTAIRVLTASSFNSAYLADYTGTHSLLTAYDGLEISAAYGCTGRIAVYGMRK